MTALRDIIRRPGRPMAELTVMTATTDPYRIDTPANHRDARWFADAWAGCGKRRIHCRGVHYVLVMRKAPTIKPNGAPYLNTAKDWDWLQTVANYARWLGYIEFEGICDKRNDEPELWLPPTIDNPGVHVRHDANVQAMPMRMPMLYPQTRPPHATQAYRLVIVGEKSSLHDVLQPICVRFEAELLLPTGDISNVRIDGIAQRAADDGRPCRVFYLSDFDPSGLTMPLVTSRKLQARCHQTYPELDIEVHRCALLADQVREMGLPETPLKESEKRAGRWRERFGCEQTEIDALATLNPGALHEIVTEALLPYFDATLQERQRAAYEVVEEDARRQIDEAMAQRADDLARAAELIEATRSANEAAADYMVPLFDQIAAEIVPIEPERVDPRVQHGAAGEPLLSSRWSFEKATQRLMQEKL
jgi:hypothetical protein